MACESCTDVQFKDLEFSSVQHDEQVKTGDTWHIFVTVRNNSFLIGDTGRVCIFDGNNVIATSGKFTLKPDETRSLKFTGVMPDEDLYLNVSLNEIEAFGLQTHCSDGSNILIKNGDVSIPIDPTDTPPQDEQTPQEWLQENIVLVLILILAIIVILKFG